MKKIIKNQKLTILLGNSIEWFEFAVYGYLAPILSSLFMPLDNPRTQLFNAFAIFAVGFIARPLGGLFWGYIGDRYGRKQALVWSIILMTLATGVLAILPTYESIGILACWFLIICRIIQGFSAGGELTSSMVFLAEVSPDSKRGLYSSLTMVTAFSGVLLGSLSGAALLNCLSNEKIELWGWRIPFLISALFGLFVFYIRKNTRETNIFEEYRQLGKTNPELLTPPQSTGVIIKIIFQSICCALSFYTIFLYLPSYIKEFTGAHLSQGLLVNTANMFLLIVLIPIFGHLSDKFGRKPILLFGSLGLTIFSIPLFQAIVDGSMPVYLIQLFFTFFIAASFAPLPAAMSEMCETSHRCEVVSFGFNFTIALLGGTVPMVAIWLIEYTDWVMAPAAYLSIGAAITSVTTLFTYWPKNYNLKKGKLIWKANSV